jgi:hypothetical protein
MTHYKVYNLSTGECWKNSGKDEVWATREEAEKLIQNTCKILSSIIKEHFMEIVETDEPVHSDPCTIKWDAALHPVLIN